MICVGIDVAKEKHDCSILNSDGEILCDVFTIQNNQTGFNTLLGMIEKESIAGDVVRVGLESTGHYGYNLLGFLLAHGIHPYVINPLHTSLFRKSMSLRLTKTDKVDAQMIATMLMSDVNLSVYSKATHQSEELKSLTRYRQDKVQERAKLKQSISRLVTIVFPELEKMMPSIHTATIYALLMEYPGAQSIANAHLTRLTHLLANESGGRYGREQALTIRSTAKKSIGLQQPAKALELRHTIRLIRELDTEISEVEAHIETIMDALDSPILSIPGIGYQTGAMIVAEIGDFNRFDSPSKILAYAGLAPSTYQSGQMVSTHAHMEKRGSKYLRAALYRATQFVCRWDSVFGAYLQKKRDEGKHYYVAISHAAKKLVRVIYHLQQTGEKYVGQNVAPDFDGNGKLC